MNESINTDNCTPYPSFIEHYNSKRLVQSAVGNVHRHFIINAGSSKTKISIYIIHFYIVMQEF